MSTPTLAQRHTQRNPQPDYVCTVCGQPASTCRCAGRTLPEERIELTQHSDGWHWRHAGKGISRNTSMDSYATPLAAAIAGARVAAALGLQLYTGDDALNADLVMHWQVEGIEAARTGKPAWTLWNSYQRQGYASVTNPRFGWTGA